MVKEQYIIQYGYIKKSVQCLQEKTHASNIRKTELGWSASISSGFDVLYSMRSLKFIQINPKYRDFKGISHLPSGLMGFDGGLIGSNGKFNGIWLVVSTYPSGNF